MTRPATSITPPRLPPGRRLAFLDGLRALAAIHVIFFHMGMTVWNSNSNRTAPPLYAAILHWFGNAHYAVVAFITLSGFCLTLPLARNGELRPLRPLEFFAKRCKRILPPYWITVLCSVALGLTVLSQKTGTVWDISIPVTPSAVLSHLALVHNITGNSATIDYPLWTIAVEWQIYLLFPALIFALRRIPPWLVLLSAFLTCYPLTFLLRQTPLAGLTLHFLVLFLLGCVACLVVRGSAPIYVAVRNAWKLVLAAALTVALATFVVNGLLSDYAVWRYQWLLDFPAGLAFASLLICFTQSPALRRPLEWAPLVAVGGFSYTVYLIHAPLLQLIWQFAVKPLAIADTSAFLLLCLAGIPLIVGASFLFFLIAEKPFITKTARPIPSPIPGTFPAPLPFP